MGTFADSLFTALMSWVRALVSGLWALFTAEHTTVLEFLGRNWMLIAVVIIAAGLVIDWIIWLLRWQPYHLWAQRARRLFGMEEPQEAEDKPLCATAAVMPVRADYAPVDEAEDERIYMPAMDETQAQAVLEHASNAPDEYAYPGMRYGSAATGDMGGTQRYGAVTQEGPGAAEVARRRAEIEAWQLQMQEEARARAEAECREREEREAQRARAEREAYEAEQARLAWEAYEAEQARLAQEAYEAEQARLAQEAYEAEQAQLAQQEYERQLAEYERQKAQYEIELAEYERQKAEYEAALTRQQAQQETAEELAVSEQSAAVRRRRSARKTYSDYIEGEAVSELPDAPQWPQPERSNSAQHYAEDGQHGAGARLLSRMAKMMETEEEQLAARTKLPPRVNMQDAYRPAAAPKKPGRRSQNV